MILMIFRSLFYLVEHNFQQDGEKYGKHPECGHYPVGRYFGNGDIRGHQVLYDPRLATNFSHDPTALGGDISQGNADKSQVRNEFEFLEFSLLCIPQGKNE